MVMSTFADLVRSLTEDLGGQELPCCDCDCDWQDPFCDCSCHGDARVSGTTPPLNAWAGYL